jgi:predicted AAA+ superfamily ATPase
MIGRNNILNTLMDEFPAVVLTGPRQVGKTTIIRQYASESGKNTVFLDLELNSDRRKLDEMEAYFELNRDKLIILDEVQFLPEVFSALRPEIDAHRKPGRFLITGSANPAIIKGVAESLAGRAAYMELTPFMQDEIRGDYTLLHHWFRGGYPEAFLAKTHAAYHRWMAQYIETFVQRDLPMMFGSGLSTVLTRNLWQMLAYNNGSILNIENYARALGVSANTVKKYLQLLEGSFMIRFLNPWFVNTNKRLVKSPKIYIRDSGLLHHLNGIESPADMPGHLAVGASWEGYVTEEIIRHLPDNVQPFFYRTHHGAEIDLVLVKNNKPFCAIEIKYSRAPKLSEGFHKAIEDLDISAKYLVYTGAETYPGPGKVVVTGLEDFLKNELFYK